MVVDLTGWPDAVIEPMHDGFALTPRLRPDWPGPGPIDLAVHDLPHASAGCPGK